MDDRGKDSRGASLIGELLIQLAQREGFRRKLADLEERGGASFVRELMDEFEKLVDRIHRERDASQPASTPRAEPDLFVPPPPIVPEPSPFSAAFSSAIKDDYKIELPPLDIRVSSAKSATPDREVPSREPKPQSPAPATPPAAKRAASPEPPPKPPEPKPPELKPQTPAPVAPPAPKRAASPEPPPKPPELKPQTPAPVAPPAPKRAASPESLPKPPEAKRQAPPPVAPPAPKRAAPPEPPPKPPESVAPPRQAVPEHAPPKSVEPTTFEKPTTPTKPLHPRSVQSLEDDDVLYFHAVSQIPLDEKPAHQPFMMEEKGINDRECTFALDRGGIRFYLSRIVGGNMNVSKTGVLLLSKQDSMRLRGVHYSILNDLRAHGVILPFIFGTVALGRDSLYSMIDDHLYDFRDALEEILSTKWWNLGVLVLDAKMAQSLASDSAGGINERERRMQGSRQPVAGRMDIKTLERVLGKQKKIAESIHEELKDLAVRSDVDMMVGLNSGSSDDWKPILRASYEVPLSAVHQFNRAVIDLQYRHFQHDLMFVLNGDREEFSFSQG